VLRRYRCIRQNDQTDCGAAALATIAMAHGIPIGLEPMRELAGTDRIGTNLQGLVQAAESIGMSARAVKAPFEALAEIPLPAIAHVVTDEGLGHFVVLHRVRRGSVVVADPAQGVVKQSREQFCQSWTGRLLITMADKTRMRIKQRGTQPVTPWRRFLSLIGAHRSILIEAFCCALVMTLLGISTSYFIQHLVDSVLVRGETQLLNALGVGMVAIVVFRGLFGAMRQYLLAYISRQVDLALI